MAVLCKAVADGLLLSLSLALLGWGAEVQENGRGMREVSGGSTVYLSQDREIWRPLIHTTVNLSEVSSIKSSFQLRTFDPEGVIFYGDTKDGEDWFVLSLKDGIPLMQMKKEDMVVSVAGGPKLNDGKWHTLEVSNKGQFVILDVDGSSGLVVGMQSNLMEEVISGKLRMALGGILINKDKMIVQFEPRMDGCVREGSWLNLNSPWEMEAGELWPCHENIQPGSYFPGSGAAIFETSVFTFDKDDGVRIALAGDFSRMHGTIFSVKAPGREPTVALSANNNTNGIMLTWGEQRISIGKNIQRLVLTFKPEELHVGEEEVNVISLTNPGVWSAWREGRLAIGSLLGEGDDNVGSNFLTGCLKEIQVQGKNLDLDLAITLKSVSSHSCPA
ncbi:sex hormone-binding globulin [Limanda limanda]|uniref:sex hormone-binding globulin n=1 Tax=Limanda limanda TaxID=27771 RepID=UPI0029C6763D|nr:sex hormone-binding globulin [Limanda limanda]